MAGHRRGRMLPSAVFVTVSVIALYSYGNLRLTLPLLHSKALYAPDLSHYAIPQTSFNLSALRPSSHQCLEERDIDRVCYFKDVFLWQGKLHYVSDDPNLELPKVSLDFRIGKNVTYVWVDTQIISQRELAEAARSAKSIVEWTGPRDEVHLWTGNLGNYGHFMGERAPTLHSTLCQYLGRCSFENRTGLHLVLDKPAEFEWPEYVDDAVACMSESRHMNMKSPDVLGTLIAVRLLLVGVGTTCRAAGHCQRSPFKPNETRGAIPPQNMRLYRDQMAACLGFSASAAAALSPKIRILVVDRHYTSGRHMLNIEHVMAVLRKRYGTIADVELSYLEGMTLTQQAHLWNSASLVIQIHGASFGNWPFLPHKSAAVVFTVAHGPGGFGNVFPRMLERDLLRVTDMSATLLNITFNPHGQFRFRAFEGWRWSQLSAEERLMLIETADCSKLSQKGMRRYCDNWLMALWDLQIPLDSLLPAVDDAIRTLYAKQGQQAPEVVLGAPITPGVGRGSLR